MKQILYSLTLLVALLALGSCGSKSKRTEQPKSYRFRYVQPPMQASQEQQFAYMREHYWDKFDFADTLYTTKADTVEMCRAYAAYISNFVGPIDQEPIRKLMQRASASKKMFDYFVMLAEQVLHDPNSPVRSDELYIAVLEAQLASPYYDKYEKMAPEHDLRIASQNRIGQKANDFRYTLKSGQTRNMHSLPHDFVIIYINNPGCGMCHDTSEAMKASPIITHLQSEGRLKILAICPDADLESWRKHYNDIPRGWINAYDKGCRIEREGLYNLNAIPALYLLDKEKRVLIKDSTNVGEIEYALQQLAQ